MLTYKKTFVLSLPVIMELFLQVLFGIVDTFCLSLISDSSVAAVSYSNQIIQVVSLGFVVFSTGVSVVLSQVLGANENNRIKTIINTSFSIVLIIGVIVSIVFICFGQYFFSFFSVGNEIRYDATIYLKVIATTLWIKGLCSLLASIFRCYNLAKYTNYTALVSNIINLILNILAIKFSVKFMGTVVGTIAINTVIANVIYFLILIMFFRKKIGIGLKITIQKQDVISLTKIGIPAAGENISYKLSQLVITTIILILGANFLTARTYALNIFLLVSIVTEGIGITTGIHIGYDAGKRDYQGIKQIFHIGIRLGVLCVLVLDIPILLLSSQLVILFTKDLNVCRIAVLIMICEGITLLVKSCNFTLGNTLRATGDVVFPTKIAIISMWGVGVGLAYFVGIRLSLGILGICMASFFDEIIRMTIMFLRFRHIVDKKAVVRL